MMLIAVVAPTLIYTGIAMYEARAAGESSTEVAAEVGKQGIGLVGAVLGGIWACRRDVRHCARARSEEHTSELQSLMRISYAVFCLKKKKTQKIYRRDYYTSITQIHMTINRY